MKASIDNSKPIKSPFEQQEKTLGKLMKDITRLFDQHVASLEQDARQPRLATEADGPANTKTRERSEGSATAVQAMHGDSCTAQRVQDGPKTNSTCFGVMAEPSDLPLRDDILVENGAASPKSCLPSLEMRSTTAAGGLLPPANLHSNEDHLQRATSSVLLDRGGEFEGDTFTDFKSTRLV